MADVKLPRLRDSIDVVTDEARPTTTFMRWWEELARAIEQLFDDVIEALEAAEDASSGASSIQTFAALGLSYPSSLTMTAHDAGSDVLLSISDHARVYGNATVVNVNAGTIAGLAYTTQYWIFYSDPDRIGGDVTYFASTDYLDAAQVGTRHALGTILTPAALAADTTGLNTNPPGVPYT